MSSASYFIYQNGKQSGPYALDRLKAFWREGTVTENSYFWQDGMADWAPLSEMGSELSAPEEERSAAVANEEPGFFLFENNTQTGPFTEDRLKERYQDSEITDATFFWREGMESWKPLREISTQLKHVPREREPEPEPEPALATATAGARGGGEQAAIRSLGSRSGGASSQVSAKAAGDSDDEPDAQSDSLDEGELAVREGPFREIVRKDAEMFGEGPISPQDSEGPFYEVLPDGKTMIRMSLSELRHAYQSGHFGPDLHLRSEGDNSWGKLADLQKHLN